MEDTVIAVSDIAGVKREFPVPKGTLVVVHVPGIHYNREGSLLEKHLTINSYVAKYWEDPNEFRPERFNGEWPREAFLPFAGGKAYVFSVVHIDVNKT